MENKDPERQEQADDGIGPEPSILDNISPWRDIFIRPRDTTRWLLAHETAASAQMLWLSFTAFFLIILFLALSFYPGNFDRAWSKIQLAMLTPVIFLVSWGYFILQSYLLCLLCRLLGGRSDVLQMRVVNSYTTVIPSVVFGIISFAVSYLFGRDSLPTVALENVTMVWAGFIALMGIATAAGITAMRSFVAYILSIVIWIAGASAAIGLLKALVPRFAAVFS